MLSIHFSFSKLLPPEANLQSMASVCSLRLQMLHQRRIGSRRSVSKCSNQSILSLQKIQRDGNWRNRVKEELVTKRRDALIHILLSSLSFQSIVLDPASAETDIFDSCAPDGWDGRDDSIMLPRKKPWPLDHYVKEEFRMYSDETNKFKISIPQDWLVGAGEPNGYKLVTAFYPEEASTSNVSVVITGIGPDFTRLESFGNVDAFAENLVNGLDRSWRRPPGLAAKLIDSKAANGLYYIEYSLQNPGESCRHIFSAIGMASNGWYNRLYTVTGQFLEEESEKYRSKIEKSVASFQLFLGLQNEDIQC